MPMKPKRGAWEDELGGDYVERLKEAGPREGESQLAFKIRMGGLQEGRDAVVGAIRRTGDVTRAFKTLGVNRRNAHLWIKRLGFLRSELEAIEGDLIRKGLPAA